MNPKARRALSDGLIVLLALLFVSPMYYMLVSSVKSGMEMAQAPLALPQALHWENYTGVAAQMNYGRTVLNTVVITAGVCVIAIVLGALAAFPLARSRSFWSRWTYQLFLTGMTIPFFVVMSPLYLLVRQIGLLNTFPGLILVMVVLNLPLSVFFFTNFLNSVPRELEEAAAIDGATALGTFWRIVLPLMRPVTSTLALLIGLAVWNSLLVPLLFLNSPQQRPLMVAIFQLLGTYSLNPATLFPAVVLGALPLLVIFIALQRQIVSGIAAGAVKG